MYKAWLYYTCKWATNGLIEPEYEEWQELTTKLNKHCLECKEGYVCETCKGSGLKLTEVEKMILRGIELSLDEARVHSVQ